MFADAQLGLPVRKQGKKIFWWRITRYDIITDCNTKAVNVDAYQQQQLDWLYLWHEDFTTNTIRNEKSKTEVK